VRATAATLDGRHLAGGFALGTAAAFVEAVEAGAIRALHADLLGDGLVAGNLGFLHFGQAALGIHHDFLADDVIAAKLALVGFLGVTGASALPAEHGAAGRKAERKGDEWQDQEQVFHGIEELEEAAARGGREAKGHQTGGGKELDHGGVMLGSRDEVAMKKTVRISLNPRLFQQSGGDSAAVRPRCAGSISPVHPLW